MKKYPRIYSLSTIGIIHHQKNDYIFLPIVLIFIGDSDSGKSIIADLLQLIFVGSSCFPVPQPHQSKTDENLMVSFCGRLANL